MAEIILSPVADLIIETLGSAAVKKIGELYRVRDDLEELRATLSTIRAVLLDAERQQTRNNQVRLWLERLADVVNDADDLVDEVATEGLRRELITMPARNRMLKKLVLRSKLGDEIRRVRKRLALVTADGRDFGLRESRDEIVAARPAMKIWREAQLLVAEESVVGRVEEKRRVLEMVMENNEVEERVRVVSIFGTGGLGKTTLARLVFNDETVQKHFDERSWVCVSRDFDARLVLGSIIGSSGCSSDLTEELQRTLQRKMNRKRYLIMLDDIWNENHQKWRDLMGILSSCGVSGSRVIVTARSEHVVKITSSEAQSYRLGVLSEDEAWSLFEKIAFGQRQEPTEFDAVAIGKEIVKKCGGIPLAIRMIASMLSVRDPKTEWPSILKEELSSLPQQENDILPALKLSYNCLPSYLKRCFACCRLFPKDHIIRVESLINLWVALGFISVTSDGSQRPEEKGYDHFLELVSRGFFQELVTDEQNEVQTCKIHDLVHDLATQAAGKEYVVLDPGSRENTCEKVRYVSSYEFEELPASLLQAKRLRSFFQETIRSNRSRSFSDIKSTHENQFGSLFPRRTNNSDVPSTCLGIPIAPLKEKRLHSLFQLTKKSGGIAHEMVRNFKFLRMLDMRRLGVEIVPNSIGELKHLRYLDLSGNDKITKLPSSITKLVNLQTLKLNGCSLKKLPRGIKKLVNLRHLEFDSAFLLYLPRGVSQWTNLQTLSHFPLSEDPENVPHSSKLDELFGLNSLRGNIRIRGIKSGIKTRGANLKAKERLQSIWLEWSDLNIDDASTRSDREREETLEGLEPHPNLRTLRIDRYDGVRFSPWISMLTNLTELRLEACLKLKQLPSLDPLRLLKQMRLHRCTEIEHIIMNYDDAKKDPPVYPTLQKLELLCLPNFRGWQSSNNTHQPLQSLSYFPCLTELSITDCPKLGSMPLYPNVEKLKLANANGKPFGQTAVTTKTFRPLSEVRDLTLLISSECYLQYFPDWMESLSSVEALVISGRETSPLESQSAKFHWKNLEWKIKESDGCEIPVERNRATWGVFSRIRKLSLKEVQAIKYISGPIQYLTSLEELRIEYCKELEFASGNSDSITFESLKCLKALVLCGISKLVTLPGWLQQITTLQNLEFHYCYDLKNIPDWICELSSLRRLDIKHCPGIESLPGSISSLTSLQTLNIFGCRILSARCERQTGDEWPKIQHIPHSSIDTFPGDFV